MSPRQINSSDTPRSYNLLIEVYQEGTLIELYILLFLQIKVSKLCLFVNNCFENANKCSGFRTPARQAKKALAADLPALVDDIGLSNGHVNWRNC